MRRPLWVKAMNKRDIKNGELDAIGKKLLKSARLSGDEIDSIVGKPALFDAVRVRIADIEEVSVRKTTLFNWKLTGAIGSTAALLLVSLYFGLFSNTETAVGPSLNQVPPPVFTVMDDPSRQNFSEVAAARPERPEAPPVSRPAAVKADYREEVRPARSMRQPAPVKDERPFHALGFAGNIEDAVRGGHIVRVDMPRSALFALGVDLPLENDAAFVKTDVLVGSNGVPRAIRFVE